VRLWAWPSESINLKVVPLIVNNTLCTLPAGPIGLSPVQRTRFSIFTSLKTSAYRLIASSALQFVNMKNGYALFIRKPPDNINNWSFQTAPQIPVCLYVLYLLFYCPAMRNSSMDSEIPNVIYETPQKTGSKIAVFCLNFCSFFAPKPLHIVVDPPHLPLEPLFVIIITHSTWLERTALMSFAPYVLGNISMAFLLFFSKPTFAGKYQPVEAFIKWLF